MHAASVHPEPGSNSRNHCIKTTKAFASADPICFRVLLLASFTFCLSSILIQRIVRDPFAHTFICFVLLSCCSIFKDHSPPLLRQLDYYTTSLPLCQYLFQKFFNFFKSFFQTRNSVVFSSPLLRTACILYHIIKSLSRGF